MQRDVAIKLISTDNESVSRLRREAQTASSLKHPNIVQVYSFGRADDQQFYLSMEWLDGGSLAERLAEHGRLPAVYLQEIVPGLLSAMKYAHERGVVHRDIKPANIVFARKRWDPKLTDFGIAKVCEGPEKGATITSSGAVIGTPLYMSPEQCTGGDVDSRSDLYSFGAVLCECLTGRPPFTAESAMELMYKHVHDDRSELKSRLLKSESPALGRIALRCLQAEPDSRFQNVDEIMTALQSPALSHQHGTSWSARLVTAGGIICILPAVAVTLNFPRTSESDCRVSGTSSNLELSYKHLLNSNSFECDQGCQSFMSLLKRAKDHATPALDSSRTHFLTALIAAQAIESGKGRLTPEQMTYLCHELRSNLSSVTDGAVRRNLDLHLMARASICPAYMGLAQESAGCLNSLEDLMKRFGLSGSTVGQLHLCRASLAILQDNPKDALHELDLAAPTIRDVTMLHAESLVYRAQAYQRLNRPSEAKRCYDELLQIFRAQTDYGRISLDSFICWLSIAGSSLHRLTGGAEGDAWFAEALKAAQIPDVEHTDPIVPLVALAASKLRCKDYLAVRDALTKGNALLPACKHMWQHMLFYNLLAELKLALNEPAGALNYTQIALELHKQDQKRAIAELNELSRSQWICGTANYQLGKSDAALTWYRRADLTLVRQPLDWMMRAHAAIYEKLLREKGDLVNAKRVKEWIALSNIVAE